MPDYKKKKVKHSGRPRVDKSRNKEIPMRGKSVIREKRVNKNTSHTSKDNLRVVKGNKLRNRRRAQVVFSVVLTLALIIGIFQFTLPTGIVDQIRVTKAGIGAKGFPVSMGGSNILNSEKRGGLIYNLSDATIECMSVGGKNVFKGQHGYSNPVLKSSATRALVFDQGGQGYKIYSPKGLISEKTAESTIISANISRCGAYALAIRGESYASSVIVCDKNGEKLYQWNSSVEIVSDVALSPNGKQLAVAVFGSNNGEYISKIYILNFESANPVFTAEYKGEFIYSLQTNANKGFFVIYGGGVDFVHWRKHSSIKFTTENDVRFYRGNSKFSLVVNTRSADKKDNTILLINKRGKQISEIKWNQSITDVALTGNHILLLCDTNIYMLDKNGKTVRSGEAGFGGVRVVGIGLENALVLTDNQINKVALKSEK